MNTAILFVVSNAACVFLGWLFGKTGRNAAVAAAAAEERDSAQEGSRMRPFRWMVVAVIVVCGVTAVSGAIVASNQEMLVEDQHQFAECVSDQFDALIEALDARSSSSREATDQLTEVFRTIVQAYRAPSPDSAKTVREAIERYYTLREEADDRLRQNPYPEPPRNACK